MALVALLAGRAYGTVSYTYDVLNPMDPDGGKGDFTLNWGAEASVVTGVGDVKGGSQVLSVTYHNLAGMTSDRPFEGMNIVTTRHRDDTVTITKAVFK